MTFYDAVVSPYRAAQVHFKQAQHSDWKGWSVHVVTAGFECIPLVNYLVLLVDLAVRWLFKSWTHQETTKPLDQPKVQQTSPPVEESSTKLEPQTQPSVRETVVKPAPVKAVLWNPNERLQTFLNKYSLNLNPPPPPLETPLSAQLDQIIEEIGKWKQEDRSSQWVSRISAMKARIQTILSLLPPDDSSCQSLKAIEEKLKKEDPYLQSQELQKVLKTLRVQEEKNLKPVYQTYEKWKEEISRLKAVEKELKPRQINSLDDYFKSLGISTGKEFSDYFGIERITLQTLGIQFLQDIDCLDLRCFEKEKEELEIFSLLCQKIPGFQVPENYLQSIRDQIRKDEEKDHVAGIDKIASLGTTWIEKDSKTAQFFEKFREFDLVRQKELLKDYLKQHNILKVWESIRVSNPTMTLCEYGNFHKITAPNAFYRLGATYHP